MQSTLIGSIQFTPDFDVQVSEFCRFIQVTVSSYLNAYHVTKIARAARYDAQFYHILYRFSLLSLIISV